MSPDETPRVATLVRQSDGSDDSASLEIQRERTDELAEQLGDADPRRFDLGVTSGFSRLSFPEKGEPIDEQATMSELLRTLRGGRFDYLVAYDDSRIARDAFYWVVAYAALEGDAEIELVEEPTDDALAWRVNRVVESEVKKREIAKSREAIERRLEAGHDHGRPPFGLRFDDAGERWVPDDPDDVEQSDFATVCKILDARDDGASLRDLARDFELGKSTIADLLDRRERYEEERRRLA